MKYAIGLFSMLLFIDDAHAQFVDCPDRPVLSFYIDARDNDIPLMDQLGDAEKQNLAAMYQRIVDIAESQLMAGEDGGAPALRMRNDINIHNLVHGDKVDGAIGIHLDLIFSLLPKEERTDLIDSFKQGVAALNGESSETFGEHQDRLNRKIVESALRSYYCPDDLENDYGIFAYVPH